MLLPVTYWHHMASWDRKIIGLFGAMSLPNSRCGIVSVAGWERNKEKIEWTHGVIKKNSVFKKNILFKMITMLFRFDDISLSAELEIFQSMLLLAYFVLLWFIVSIVRWHIYKYWQHESGMHPYNAQKPNYIFGFLANHRDIRWSNAAARKKN